jgi:hypothetical protein
MCIHADESKRTKNDRDFKPAAAAIGTVITFSLSLLELGCLLGEVHLQLDPRVLLP